MEVMVCHFVSDSHEVMIALIVVLPLIVVVEISLQLHRSHSEIIKFFFQITEHPILILWEGGGAERMGIFFQIKASTKP
jgi:hypothetical protein